MTNAVGTYQDFVVMLVHGGGRQRFPTYDKLYAYVMNE